MFLPFQKAFNFFTLYSWFLYYNTCLNSCLKEILEGITITKNEFLYSFADEKCRRCNEVTFITYLTNNALVSDWLIGRNQ
jgi:hypothetical protein